MRNRIQILDKDELNKNNYKFYCEGKVVKFFQLMKNWGTLEQRNYKYSQFIVRN